MRLRTVARHWEDWATARPWVPFAALGLGLVLPLWVDSILLRVVGFTLVGFLTLMGVVGAFGREWSSDGGRGTEAR